MQTRSKVILVEVETDIPSAELLTLINKALKLYEVSENGIMKVKQVQVNKIILDFVCYVY